jgi:hypothetical protein
VVSKRTGCTSKVEHGRPVIVERVHALHGGNHAFDTLRLGYLIVLRSRLVAVVGVRRGEVMAVPVPVPVPVRILAVRVRQAMSAAVVVARVRHAVGGDEMKLVVVVGV